MVIHTKDFATSTGGQEEGENLAYAYCVDGIGYCLSVCRLPGEDLVEVMVMDQANHRCGAVGHLREREWWRVPQASMRRDARAEPTAATNSPP